MNNHEQAPKLVLEGFDISLASVEAYDPQSFVLGARWAEAKVIAALRPTEQPEAAQDERAQFEKIVCGAIWSTETYKDDEGFTLYVEDWVQGAWIGWQDAKRDAALQALVDQAQLMGEYDDPLQSKERAALTDELRNMIGAHMLGDFVVQVEFQSCRAASAFQRALLSLSQSSGKKG